MGFCNVSFYDFTFINMPSGHGHGILAARGGRGGHGRAFRIECRVAAVSRRGWLLAAAALLAPHRAGARERGIASWYGRRFRGRRMANGRRFDPRAATVAHRRLPLGTRVRVRNLRNGRVVVAEVTDRGPDVPGRILDVSRGVAERLDMVEDGLAPVEITVLSKEKG